MNERAVHVRDLRVAHPPVCGDDLPRGRLRGGVGSVSRLVQKRPLGVTKARARQGNRCSWLGGGPRRRLTGLSQRGADVTGLGVVVGHPRGLASLTGARGLVLRRQLRGLAAVLEPALPTVLAAHQLPPTGPRRESRAAATNATTAPALASSPAPTAARVAGTTFS